MQECDLAISAAGTTLYELCATGIPTITYTLADNQLIAADQFAKQGIMINAGDCRHDKDFISHLEYLMESISLNLQKRANMAEKMQQLVDGLGVERIVNTLL